MLKNVGIVGYGAYVPPNRLRVGEVAAFWGKNPTEVEKSLGVFEKAIPSIDEDAVTMGVEAGLNALRMARITPKKLGAVYVGSESHPYAVNPSATTIGEVLGIGRNYLAADLEFACKAGTAGIQNIAGLLESNLIEYGMAIGTDASQARPHDALEYTAGAGAAAFILGRKKAEMAVQVLDFVSYTSDTPDFWRRDGIAYPSHQGRFSGEPAYFCHVLGAAQKLLTRTGLKQRDFAYCIFHMPNGKFPVEAAKRLGFKQEQLNPGLIVKEIGNPYSASSLLGLSAVLDIAKPGQLLFLTSYGSGAGSDSFILKTTKVLTKVRREGVRISDFLRKKHYVSYSNYLKLTEKV
jgi:hydroxymethylglutaryl-CoA synthase